MPLFRDIKTPEFLRLDSAEKAAPQNGIENPRIPFSVAAASLFGAKDSKPEM